MANDVVFHRSATVAIERSIFGVDENRYPGEADRPYWVDLPMDREEPVRVGLSMLRVVSRSGTHDAQVTIEVRHRPSHLNESDFEFLGEWAYRSSSGRACVFNIDGPILPFELEPNSEYRLHIWRSHAGARELQDSTRSMTEPEEYVIQFCSEVALMES
ncbi:hypothetical protein [Streptomyces sp. Sge12]|uniref:hypothetical protein n=1 Tax=Streptomyces sp. Sge12 TaxID=1972846 RepID=UPI0013311C18|nr:hypothetical protein [Streptomyces sp. Sge12]